MTHSADRDFVFATLFFVLSFEYTIDPGAPSGDHAAAAYAAIAPPAGRAPAMAVLSLLLMALAIRLSVTLYAA